MGLAKGFGFGRRAETDVTNQATRIALALPGRPVKLTWTREEDIRHDYYRPGAIARLRGAVGPEGPVAVRYLGTIQDVTARRELEEAERETAQRLRLAMEAGRMVVQTDEQQVLSISASSPLSLPWALENVVPDIIAAAQQA